MTEIAIRGRVVPPGPIRSASGGPLNIGRHGGLLHEAPAVVRPDWLPEGATPELDQLRDQQQALLGSAAEVDSAIAELRARYAAEDEAHAEALRARARGEAVELPGPTPPDERAAELASLEAQAVAIGEVIEQFAADTIAEITDKYDAWTAALDEEDAEAARRVEEARRALAEAEAALGQRGQLRAWLQRTAGRHPVFRDVTGRHIAFGALAGVAGPQPEVDRGPMLGDPPPPSVTATDPAMRAALLAERARNHDALTSPEEDR